VSLHAPYNEETHHLINARTLSYAKPGLLLVNTARGPLIDLDALYEAMKSGQVGGAGLDVLPQEPPTPLPALLAGGLVGGGRLAERPSARSPPYAAFFSPPGNLDIRRKASEVVCSYLRDRQTDQLRQLGRDQTSLLKKRGAKRPLISPMACPAQATGPSVILLLFFSGIGAVNSVGPSHILC